MRFSCALILVAGLVGPARHAHADGDALTDTLGPREIAVGEALRGAATGASAIGLNPAGLPLNRELVFEGGYGYRLSDDASLFGASACDSTNAAPGCFYYNYAGSDPDLAGVQMHRRTHVGGTAIAYPVSPRVFVGSGVKYFNFKDEAMPSANDSGWAFDLGLTMRMSDMINVGVSGQNIKGGNAHEFPRAVGGGILARPSPSFAISFDARWKLIDGDHSMRYGGGAELFLRTGSGQTAFPIRVGGLHDNGLGATYLSGGLGMASLRWGVDVTARYAVSGAEATMVIASMRFYGPRLQGQSTDVSDAE